MGQAESFLEGSSHLRNLVEEHSRGLCPRSHPPSIPREGQAGLDNYPGRLHLGAQVPSSLHQSLARAQALRQSTESICALNQQWI